jgi:SAM-dependent methyltransferase
MADDNMHKPHHEKGDSGHGHEHQGHENDQGFKAMLRYLRMAPRMWRSEVNDAVVDMINPEAGEVVVDIGAGMGPGAVRAARSGAFVVAVEPAAYMRRILVARSFFRRNRSTINVVDGAAESLPVSDKSVDAVWAVNTMHHWTNAEDGAVEIVRALRPGGRVVLVDENFDDLSHPEYERFKARHGGDDQHGFKMVDAKEIGALLSTAGLVQVLSTEQRLVERPVLVVTGRAADDVG